MKATAQSVQEHIAALHLESSKFRAPQDLDLDHDLINAITLARAEEAPPRSALGPANLPGSWLQLEPPVLVKHKSTRAKSGSLPPDPTRSSYLILDARGLSLTLRSQAASTGPGEAALAAMAEANWTHESRIRAEMAHGVSNVVPAFSSAIVHFLDLRRMSLPTAAGTSQPVPPIFVRQVQTMPIAALACHIKSEVFQGTVLAYAARFLDAPILDRLCKKLPLNNTPVAGVNAGDFGLPNLLCWATVCLESPYWSQHAELGMQTLKVILRQVDRFCVAKNGRYAQDSRDSVMRIIIKSQRIQAMSLVAEELERWRHLGPHRACPYLAWAARDGWVDGVQLLLDMGVDANARMPSAKAEHPNYESGITPLIAAITSDEISDETSLLVCAKLLAQGALPFATVFLTYGGFAYGDLAAAQTCAGRVGLERRWGKLPCGRPQDPIALVQSAIEKIEKSLAGLLQMAHFIERDPHSVQVLEIVEGLSVAYRILMEDFYIAMGPAHSALKFVQDSGYLLVDQVKKNGLDEYKKEVPHDVQFEGVSYPTSPASLQARIVHWACAMRALGSKIEIKPAAEQIEDVGDPCGWLNDLNQLLVGNLEPTNASLFAICVLRRQFDQLEHFIQDPKRSTTKALGLGLWAIVSQLERTSDAEHKQQLFDSMRILIAHVSDTAKARAFSEIALRAGVLKCVEKVLAHCKLNTLKLVETAAQSGENLLHLAAEGSQDLCKVFCQNIPAAWRAAWLRQRDDLGDNPLHRAARTGAAQVANILRGLELNLEQEVLAQENSLNQTPALTALAHNQLPAFFQLVKRRHALGSGAALATTLAARRGGLTGPLLTKLMQADATAALIRTHAGTLARRLARLADTESLTALMQVAAPEALAVRAQASSVLHAVAQGDAEAALEVIRRYASPGQLKVLVCHPDSRGRTPDACADNPAMQEALAALRGAAAPTTGNLPQVWRWGPLYELAHAVAQQTASDDLERSVDAFCRRAQADLQEMGQAAGAVKKVQHLAWQVIDHIDRAPMGHGMRLGTHLAIHRPEMELQQLKQRAATTLSGATRFSLDGGLALLQGRRAAITQAKSRTMHAGMRVVIEVPCPGLGGTGFINVAGASQPCRDAHTLRTVFAQTPRGLVLVTAYAV